VEAMRVSERFSRDQYVIRRKVFKLFGGAFHIYDAQGDVVFYSKMKAFTLKEDIRLYTGEDLNVEVLTISARQMLDFSSAYDVVDPTTHEKVGALRRKGLKSIVRDEWIFMDASDQEIGLIREDSMLLALVRRFLTNLVPQKYSGDINGTQVCTFRQHFNPFVFKLEVDFRDDRHHALDRRLGIAAAVLLSAVEGRQH
jgi:uncharacterized protein YxjI